MGVDVRGGGGGRLCVYRRGCAGEGEGYRNNSGLDLNYTSCDIVTRDILMNEVQRSLTSCDILTN